MQNIFLALTVSAIALESPAEPTCLVNVPTTAEAAGSAELLNRAALAVCELINSRNEHITSLWIYPTNTANTVYVQYTSMKAQSSVNVEHLALAEMQGD